MLLHLIFISFIFYFKVFWWPTFVFRKYCVQFRTSHFLTPLTMLGLFTFCTMIFFYMRNCLNNRLGHFCRVIFCQINPFACQILKSLYCLFVCLFVCLLCCIYRIIAFLKPKKKTQKNVHEDKTRVGVRFWIRISSGLELSLG